MQKMTPISELRLLISIEDFKQKYETLKNLAEELHKRPIQNEDEYNTYEIAVANWYQRAHSLFRDSFNSQINKFEYQFRTSHSRGAETLNQPNFQLHYKVKTKKDWLFQAKEGLVTLYNTLSVCDLVLGVNKDETEQARDFDFNQKVFFALYLLNKLPSQFYPIPDLLLGNGVVFEDNTEQNQVFSALVKFGFITGIHGSYGQLTVQGKMKAAEITAATEKVIEEEKKAAAATQKTGKIFISHSHKDHVIVGKFIDLVLDNGLNIDTVNMVYCTSLDGSKPKTGIDFKNSIKEGLVTAPVVLQFLSKGYKSSEVCLNEMGAAWVLSDNVFPLVIDGEQYDVGFIHGTNQQAQLHNKSDILKLTDELKDIGLWGGNVKITRLNSKIDEFVTFIKGYSITSNAVKSASVNSLENDLQILQVYCRTKNYTKIRITQLGNINPKYDKDFVIELMRQFPTKITLTSIDGADAIHLLD